ncbi:MAG: hypothetical protein J6V68_04040 [Clostridia bacterium]|nr:hypothetical protein [Clostridia bacterium]
MQTVFTISVSIILFSVLLAILPDGKTKPIIKWLFSIIFSLILINSLNDLNINIIKTNQNSTKNQQTYYISTVAILTDEYNSNLFSDLTKNYNLDFKTFYEINGGLIKYKKIQIDLKNTVINDENKHINIQNELTTIINAIYGDEINIEFL